MIPELQPVNPVEILVKTVNPQFIPCIKPDEDKSCNPDDKADYLDHRLYPVPDDISQGANEVVPEHRSVAIWNWFRLR